jgi:hypothetical protein
LLITVRDHVVYNNDDKKWFLECHPLQRFYGGENAFTVQQYRDAIEGCGLKIVRQLSHFESVINYFPMTREHRETLVKTRQAEYKKGLAAKIGALVRLPYLAESIAFVRGIRDSRVFDERKIPGRMYTFISRKDA